MTASAPPGIPLTRMDSVRNFLRTSSNLPWYSFSIRAFSSRVGCLTSRARLRRSASRAADFFSYGRAASAEDWS